MTNKCLQSVLNASRLYVIGCVVSTKSELQQKTTSKEEINSTKTNKLYAILTIKAKESMNTCRYVHRRFEDCRWRRTRRNVEKNGFQP